MKSGNGQDKVISKKGFFIGCVRGSKQMFRMLLVLSIGVAPIFAQSPVLPALPVYDGFEAGLSTFWGFGGTSVSPGSYAIINDPTLSSNVLQVNSGHELFGFSDDAY